MIPLGRNKRRDAAAPVSNILTRHAQRHKRPCGLGTPITLRRRELKPLVRLDSRLGRSFRKPVEAGAMVLHAEVMLGSGVSQVRRLLHPAH